MFILRAIVGVSVFLGICYLLSNSRKSIDWRLVITGIGLQFVLGLLIIPEQLSFFGLFNIPSPSIFFSWVSGGFVKCLEFADKGAAFVFGDWPTNLSVVNLVTGKPHHIGFVFAFKVLPAILFFAGLSSFLYYIGFLQFIIKKMAWVMKKTMRISGAESLSMAANIFIGQSEAPLIVKPYLSKMSNSELFSMMTGGMATIAGSVFGTYVLFLGGEDPIAKAEFAKHLLAASIMSAPAAIVVAKIMYPEKNKDYLEKQSLNIPRQEAGTNVLDAIVKGTIDGVKLAVYVGAMLLVFTAFVAMINYFLINLIGDNLGLNAWVSSVTGGTYNQFNLEFVLGSLFAPVAWLIGIDSQDVLQSGQLLGIKTTVNEFMAYAQLKELKGSMSERSVRIMTYALCGFANFASIGIQISGVGSLVPERRKDLAKMGFKSLIGGTIACFLTALIASLII